AQESLIKLSHRIHGSPELGFEEHNASRWLCELLSDAGLNVKSGICGLSTAFAARIGSGPLHVAICAEYDCLPGIGHACGHNIIAAMAAGAGIAAARLADALRLTGRGIGTPGAGVSGNGGQLALRECRG